MNKTLLNIQSLSIGFQTEQGISPAVRDVSFSIQRGETFALVGESGCGKTITALSILQLLPPSARVDNKSKILLEDKDLLTYSEIMMRTIRGRRIGIIFQEAMTALNPVLTIQEQIGETLVRHLKLRNKQRKARTHELLKEVGTPDPEHCAKSYIHELSGGMRQRAMIAMALAGEPELLIADEPTTSLDVTLQAQVLTLLRDIQTRRGMSILFITHDLAIVRQMADQVAVIHNGKIVEMNSNENFFNDPQHPYSKKLFASLPKRRAQARDTDTAAKETTLSVKNLKVHFPSRGGLLKRVVSAVKAVDGVSLTIKKGETLALVGESGSGKTTVGKAVLRLIEPTAGQVHLQSRDIATISARVMRRMRQHAQIIFQDPYSSLNPRMLVGDIIAEGLTAQGLCHKKDEQEQRIIQLLKQVELDPACRFRYPHEFSGGQRQRICIARALSVGPQFIVCDEPTSALDATVQAQILALLRSLQTQHGLSYLLITHHFGVVGALANHVAVMYKGRIVEYGEAHQILDNPQHPYTQQLLASVPTLDPSQQGSEDNGSTD